MPFAPKRGPLGPTTAMLFLLPMVTEAQTAGLWARGTPTPFPRAHPTWSPDGEWIAYDAKPHGNWDVFIARPDGREVRRLTTQAGRDVGPRWHPGSERVHFLSDRAGAGALKPYEFDLATGEIRPVTVGELGSVEVWISPDERRVAFHRPGPEGPEVWWASIDGSQANPVADGHPINANPVWSRDGRVLAFSEGDSLTFRIRVVDGTGETVLSVPNDSGRDVPRDLDLDAGGPIATGTTTPGERDIRSTS